MHLDLTISTIVGTVQMVLVYNELIEDNLTAIQWGTDILNIQQMPS